MNLHMSITVIQLNTATLITSPGGAQTENIGEGYTGMHSSDIFTDTSIRCIAVIRVHKEDKAFI